MYGSKVRGQGVVAPTVLADKTLSQLMAFLRKKLYLLCPKSRPSFISLGLISFGLLIF